MGHPKKLRKKYESPKRPFGELAEEEMIKKEFGLKTKKEIWRAKTELRNRRRRAREIQASKEPEQQEISREEKLLMAKVNSLGIEAVSLEDILKLNLKNLLARRLQTIAFKKGIGGKIMHTRQIIVHGHVKLNGKIVKFPAMFLSKEDENNIECDLKIERVLEAAKESKAENKE